MLHHRQVAYATTPAGCLCYAHRQNAYVTSQAGSPCRNRSATA